MLTDTELIETIARLGLQIRPVFHLPKKEIIISYFNGEWWEEKIIVTGTDAATILRMGIRDAAWRIEKEKQDAKLLVREKNV